MAGWAREDWVSGAGSTGSANQGGRRNHGAAGHNKRGGHRGETDLWECERRRRIAMERYGVPEDLIRRLKRISIRGRMALAVTCLEQVVAALVPDRERLDPLFDLLWSHVETDRLDVWEGAISVATQEVYSSSNAAYDPTGGFAPTIPAGSVFENLPRLVIEMLAAVVEVGTGNVYAGTGAFSEITLVPTLKILAVYQENGFPLPPLEPFERSSFSEHDGWGHRVDRSFFRSPAAP